MKPQTVYIGAALNEFTHQVTDGNKFDYVKPLTAIVFTPEEFEAEKLKYLKERAGEIWEAALDGTDKHTFGGRIHKANCPDKGTYISSLTNKKQ